jgi:flagellar motor switch protein FliG
MQGEIAYRLTTMLPVAPETASSIEKILQGQLMGDGSSDLKDVGGLDALVSVLNNADRATERKILEYLEEIEASIAENVKLRMFVYEDIANLDTRAIQRIIREAEQDDMRLSLKGAAQAVKDAMFSNMSERAAEALKEDLETMGPVKVKDVEAARRRIVATVRRLEDAGEITIREDTEEVID